MATRATQSILDTSAYPTGRYVAMACCLAGLALSGLLAALSDGVHHDDDLTHYLYAKWSADRPAYLLHIWARPGFTVLYALPAQVGWLAARGFSSGLTVLAAWLAYRIAERMSLPRAWLVAPLALIQPMCFQLSYTTLTETAAAFYVTLAVWLLVTRRHGWSAFVLSLAFVTRYETVVWLPIWLLAMWHGRARWPSYLWLVWAPLLHNVLSAPVYGHVPILMFLTPRQDVQYGSGSALALVGRAVLAFGPGMAALGCLGVARICRRRRGWVVAGVVVIYFGCHVACRYLGLYATGGYPRFLVPVSPIVAILAVAAVNALADWSAPRWWLRPAGVAVAFLCFWFAAESEAPWWVYPPFLLAFRLVTGGVVLLTAVTIWVRLKRPRLRWVRWLIPVGLVAITIIQTGYRSRPWRMNAEHRSVASVVDWLKANGYGDRAILATSAWVYHLWPMQMDPRNWNVRQKMAEAPPRTILIWDRRHSSCYPHHMWWTDYANDPNYRLLTKSRPAPGVFCYAFEKLPP